MATNTSNGCPYKGLQPYTEEDRAYFFGRERDTEVIASNLYIAPLTILYGTSGVGKSSVLQAGVMPHLRENRRVIVLLFNNWQGDNFNDALKERVLHAVCASTGKTQQDVLREVSNAIGTKEVVGLNRLSLDDLVTACAVAFRRRILMIFDQFEEYFLYHTATTGSEGFDAEFARAVNHPESGVNFMISMREEELSKLDRFRPRIPNLLSNLLRLDNLDGEAANNAIRKPLQVYNERHPADGMSIEDGLVTAIIEQVRPDYAKHAAAAPLSTNTETVGTQRAVDKIGTPFLQLVLLSLWEAERQNRSRVLRLQTFEDLGGALEIARTHLDKVMAQVTESQCATAAAVLRFLVTPTGSKIALDAASLASFANKPEDEVLAVLDLLGSGKEMRILRKVTTRGQDDRYELFHDVLGPAILDWRSRYEQAQRVIEERAQVEKEFSLERQRRMLQAVTILVVLLVVMAATSVYAFSKRSEARRQFAEAERQRGEAVRQFAEAQRQRQEAFEQKRIADLALVQAQEAQSDLAQAKRESDAQKDLALLAKERETAARQIAEVEKQRANAQANLATNLVRISEFNLKGFAAARLGNTDESIINFNQALNLAREQKNAPSEANALVNVADSYGTKGSAIPLELFTIFDNYEGTDYDDLVGENYQAASYVMSLERMVRERKETLLADQAKAIESYQAAIEANRRQNDPDLKKEAWIQQRIGDVQVSLQIVRNNRDAEPDLSPVFKSYDDASDSYSRAGLPLEEGILQTRIAFLWKLSSESKDVNKPDTWQKAVSAYDHALKAFQKAGVKSREAATLVRLGKIYTESPATNPEHFKAAIGYYSQAAELYGKLGERQKEAENYSVTAGLYTTKLSPPDKNKAFENYEKALTAFQAAEGELPKVDDPKSPIYRQRESLHKRVLEHIKHIGSLYAQDPKLKEDLEKYFEGVVAAYGSDRVAKANTLHAIGDLYNNDLRDKLTAINYYRAESQVWKEEGNHLRQAGVLLTIGNFYNSLNDRANTKLSFEEAQKIYQELAARGDIADRDQVASNLISMARTYTDWGENELALETYDQALSLFEGKPGTQPLWSYRIGEIVQSASKLLTETKAPGFFDRLRQFYRNRNDIAGEALALEQAGDLYAGWSKIREALEYYNHGLKLRPTNYSRLARVGKLYYNLKDEAGAKKFFQSAVQSYHDLKDSTGEVNALTSIGAFYRDVGNTTEAINYYTESVQTFCGLKNSYGQSNSLRVLSDLFKSLGESEEADRLSKLADDPKTVSNCDFRIKRRP